MKVVWTENAVIDLERIEDYIYYDSPERAIAFVEKLLNKGESLKDHIMRGRMVPEFGDKNIRELIEGNYRIVYRIAKQKIEILTIFEGHKLLQKNFVEESLAKEWESEEDGEAFKDL